MTEANTKAPWHLWVVGALAVLFNALGAFDYLMSKLQGEAYMSGMGMTPEQIAHVTGMPLWMMTVWPIGVWGALLASVFLLMRRTWAMPVFLVSTAAWFINLAYTYILTDGGAIMGTPMTIMSVIITAELLFLIWYARAMTARGVLR